MIINIETCDPSTGYQLCVYPRESRRKRSSWIMWISPDGSADLYTERAESGAVQGEPIHLAASVARAVPKESTEEDDDNPLTAAHVTVRDGEVIVRSKVSSESDF